MRSKKKLVLITNDDGINAPGIRALIEIVNPLADFVVVAPDKPQSGMGHAITIDSTLRIFKHQIDGRVDYSTTGTPVDCVKLALGKVLSRKPDLIVSGINHGSNSSINVIYSGTMSAAVEGVIEGIPSVGFSFCNSSIEADFSFCNKHVTAIIKQLLQHKLAPGICLNVNIPSIDSDKINGIKICRQADARWEEEFDERTDPSGKKYFWLTGIFKNYDKGKDTDEWALKNNYVSIVPVQIDFTAHKEIPELKKWKFEI